MCAPVAMAITAIGGAYSAYNQYKQGVAQSNYYNYQSQAKKQEADYDLKMGQKQSELIGDTGKMEEKSLSVKQAEFNASQQASNAARGVEGGTAEDIASSTFDKEQLDKQMVRYNSAIKGWETMEQAKNQSWAANIESDQYGMAAKNAKKAGKLNAFSTLLSSAASVGTMGWLSAGK